MNAAFVIVLAYLMGSIPFAFLLSRQRGVDLRQAGSGNVGATNVLRTTGTGRAVAAMVLDGVKGTVAVLLAQLLSLGLAATVAAACASVMGHVYPVWLRFKGGKGVATAAGAFAVLSPGALGIAVAVFIVAVAITRFISVGSMAAALTLAIVTVFTDAPGAVTMGAVAMTTVIVFRHRGNLARLAAGTERRVGRAPAGTAPSQ
jgi:glycerol-3-phosphate acyltransferase PlsY